MYSGSSFTRGSGSWPARRSCGRQQLRQLSINSQPRLVLLFYPTACSLRRTPDTRRPVRNLEEGCRAGRRRARDSGRKGRRGIPAPTATEAHATRTATVRHPVPAPWFQGTSPLARWLASAHVTPLHVTTSPLLPGTRLLPLVALGVVHGVSCPAATSAPECTAREVRAQPLAPTHHPPRTPATGRTSGNCGDWRLPGHGKGLSSMYATVVSFVQACEPRAILTRPPSPAAYEANRKRASMYASTASLRLECAHLATPPSTASHPHLAAQCSYNT